MSNYGERSGAGGGGETRPMFSATCASCRKPCMVPFKPDGSRPVYCKECFRTKIADSEGGDARRQSSFSPSSARRNVSQPPQKMAARPQPSLDSISAKLDKIIAMLGASAPTSAAAAVKTDRKKLANERGKKPARRARSKRK